MSDTRPNILFIICDQLSLGALDCERGDGRVQTPALDALMAGSMRFDHACCASPVCIPSRNSIFTGLHPHQTGITCNRSHPRNPQPGWPNNPADKLLPDDMRLMGDYAQQAGYETAYFGKWHINIDHADTARHGFTTCAAIHDTGHDPAIAEATADFLCDAHTRPFLAVASFCDPHDICQHAAGKDLPGGPLPPPPPLDGLPRLPANAAETGHAGQPLADLVAGYRALHLAQQDDDAAFWRRYAWAYDRLIERLDACVARVLEALAASGRQDETVVIFTSDHGDLQGAHRLAQKSFFYDEALRVPLCIRAPGIPSGDCAAAVNIGTDLLPTILDYCGATPSGLPGRSLRPLVEGAVPAGWPQQVVSQVHLCNPQLPAHLPHVHARCVRSRDHSYWCLDHGPQREMLFDCVRDPGQLRNLADDPAAADILTHHRAALQAHAAQHGDRIAAEMLTPCTRSTA